MRARPPISCSQFQKDPMPIFTETQRPRQSWLFLVIVALAAIGWGVFIQQIVRGNPIGGSDPMPDSAAIIVGILLGVALPLFFLWFKMETTVYADRVEVRMKPFSHRVFRKGAISAYSAGEYRPVREFGGWGIRGWGANRAYSISGNQGVRLQLRDGNRVLIGTQRPQELAAAIEAMH